MAKKTIEDAEREAKRIIRGWTVGAALAGWVPGSAVILTATDTAMIAQVARAFDVTEIDMENVTVALGRALAGGATASYVAETLSLLPLAGWAIKGTAMAAKTHIVGYNVIGYFRVRSKLPRSGEDPPNDSPSITISVD